MIVNYPSKTKTIPMTRNSTRSIGALHPIIFFLCVYGLSLFLALFVCRTVYYSINEEPASRAETLKADNGSDLNVTASLK
jgi:hypothetical protein